MEQYVRFEILGPLRITAGTGTVALTANRERTLLAILLLHANHPVPCTQLIEAIWPNQPPPGARNQLQGCVSRLRGRLAGAGSPTGLIVTDPAGYRATVTPDQLDLLQFRHHVAKARRAADGADRTDAVNHYRAGLALWHGPALAGIDGDPIRHAAAALDEEHAQALEERIELELATGTGPLIAELTDLVGRHPHREGLHRALMLALYRTGRQADALAAYRRARQLLHDELGIEPGAELQRLHQAILNRDPSLDTPPQAVPTRTVQPAMAPVPRELPADVAGFTGRTEALKALDALLAGAPDTPPAPVVISAIAGTAGVGKTALAVHWAHQVADQFPDGQLYLNLRGYAAEAPLQPVEALAALLRSLGTPPEQIPTDEAQAAGRYRSELAGRRALVVLDNAGSIEQVRPLLPGSAGCLALVTSRDRLTGLVAWDGARRLTLDVLTPDEAHELLIRLLGTKRVAAEAKAARALARACAYLPLALRVAAAGLLDRLDRSISGYIAELTGGDRLAMLQAVGDKHSAVRAALDHSYQRLPAEARQLFRLLGLVPGVDFTAPAAAALTGAPEKQAKQLLDRLTSVHLVEEHLPGRYTFHDLLWLYAGERAEQEGDEPARQDALHRLLDWYASGTDAAANSLYKGTLRLPVGPSQATTRVLFTTPAEALAWLDVERTNLVAAIEYAADHGPRRLAWLLADGLRRYFWLGRHSANALRAATAALTAAEQEQDLPAQAIMCLGLGDALIATGRYEEAVERIAAACQMAHESGWDDGEGGALMNLGTAYVLMGQLQPARRHLTEALRLYQRTGLRDRELRVLGSLGFLHGLLGDLQQSADLHTQQVAIYRQLGPGRVGSLARALVNLGSAELDLGQLDQASEHLTFALALHRHNGDRFGEANALDELAKVQLAVGRLDKSVELAHAAMTVARNFGDPRHTSAVWATLGSVHHKRSRPEVAVECHKRSIKMARQNRVPDVETRALVGLAAAECHLEQYEDASGHAIQALESARAIGYRVSEGMALTVLAEIRLEQGRYEDARDYARQAVANHRKTGHRLGEANALAALGTALHRGGDPQAREHWLAALELYTSIGAPVPEKLAEVR